MKTVGEILKTAREKKKVTFAEVESQTKIRKAFLEILEKNEFGKIPGGAIVAKGFIKNYAKFLDLSPQKLLATFRRDFIENEKGQVLPRGYYEPLNRQRFSWTPKLTVATAVFFLIFALFSYLSFQAISFLGRPPLQVFSPAQEERVTGAEILLSGKTDPDAQVLINGNLTAVDGDGNFKKEVILLPGENRLTIEAISRRGKKTKIVRKVMFEPERAN